MDSAGRKVIEEAPEMPSIEDFNIYSNSSVQMQRNTSRGAGAHVEDVGSRTFEEPQVNSPNKSLLCEI